MALVDDLVLLDEGVNIDQSKWSERTVDLSTHADIGPGQPIWFLIETASALSDGSFWDVSIHGADDVRFADIPTNQHAVDNPPGFTIYQYVVVKYWGGRRVGARGDQNARSIIGFPHGVEYRYIRAHYAISVTDAFTAPLVGGFNIYFTPHMPTYWLPYTSRL